MLNLSKNVEEGMCSFEFYLDEVFLSEEGKASLTKRVGETSTLGLFLTWSFYEQEAAYTAIFEGPDAQIDCMYSESLLIELHLAVDDISVPVAYCKISLKYCISYPKTSLNNSATFIPYTSKNDSQENLRSAVKALLPDCDFGILQYQYGFNCPKKSILTYLEMVSRNVEMQECNCSTQELVDEEYGVNEELKKVEKASDLPGEQNTSDENVLCPECTEKTPELPPKPAPRNLKPPIEESIDSNVEKIPQIVIEIHSLQLSPKSSVAKDPNIHQLFIEYTFLGKQGESMETPVSLPKPQSNEILCFNFRKVFPMDPVENAKERNILKNVIYMRGSKRHKSSLLAEGKVRFNVVSEPLEDEDSDVECLDIGFV
ncbi:hypothetical protein J437_LFUL013758 [Ladona fulva]|uniref:RPGRIP1 C-terminal domain-containing protein n=1 Tax=Ladona fulva TaxID=123851 RepID=A0A8K0KGF9_LADFU|nr:hypothetical protein J437_LFUL013758 [Ladona fulva]